MNKAAAMTTGHIHTLSKPNVRDPVAAIGFNGSIYKQQQVQFFDRAGKAQFFVAKNDNRSYRARLWQQRGKNL